MFVWFGKKKYFKYFKLKTTLNNTVNYDALKYIQEIKDFRDVINVNLLGCFIVSCLVAKSMIKKNRGNIINIASISGGKHPAIHTGAYAASKAGIIMLTEQMSLEWGKQGIRVKAVSPGFINAGMAASHYKNKKDAPTY